MDKSRPTILIVDDTPTNLTLLTGLLNDEYRVKIANNGTRALELAFSSPPDLVLLDVMMPGIDGYEVCSRLKQESITCHVPVIFLTAKSSVEDEEHGFEVGAVDFIHKPISPPIVKTRVRNHLRLKEWQDSLIDNNQWLENEVSRRLTQVNQLKDATIHVMVSLAEFRDECTGNHIRRTQAYVKALAEKLAQSSKHHAYLTPDKIDLIAKSAPLHDVGKITIPDGILLKPDKHTSEEFSVMKTHSQRGYKILKQAADFMGGDDDFLNCAMDIALYHHEKWDGSGYPFGLHGDEIPVSARLMAVADVYDALRSIRPYKDALTHEEAIDVIKTNSGNHLDPEIVDALIAIEDQCISIADSWPDETN
ncbi:two-component system response regulator [Vibrio hannami]|uniref:response regulator n=1 Tax=Vibrio hannami TaxID=2717094 RepID=UPI00240FF5D2|nr:two-component system response regulator [Vibrio hannami]MDG3085839.1 two-component system response regulator [Vibrio hannami]